MAQNIFVLPIEGDLAEIWQRINKCINSLHLKNHVRKECSLLYNPDKIKNVLPEANTMCAEQTFCWLGRWKIILVKYRGPPPPKHILTQREQSFRNK